MVQFWDDLFDLGDKVGLRYLIAPWDNYWMWRRFEHHPYNAKNGGPASTPAAFFTDEATLAAIDNRFEWVARRYAIARFLARGIYSTKSGRTGAELPRVRVKSSRARAAGFVQLNTKFKVGRGLKPCRFTARTHRKATTN
jgi:hypothetical protein